MHSPSETEWPYSTPISTAYPSTMPRITTDPDQYALGTGSILPPSTGGPYSMQVSNRAQSFDSTPYMPAVHRQSSSTNYHSGVEATSSQYGSQPPRHGLPVHLSQAPTTAYSTPDFSPPWTSLSSTPRSMSTNYAFQTESPSGYQSNSMPYLPAGGLSFPAASTVSTPVFPGLSPLASSLPYNGPSRALPIPETTQSSLPDDGAPLQDDDSGLGAYPQQVTSRASISTVPREVIQVSESSSSTASSSPGENNHKSSNMGYGNLNYSSQGGALTIGPVCPCGDHPSRINNEGNYTTSSSGVQIFQQGIPHLPNINSQYSVQDMSTGFGVHGSSVNPAASGGSLLGGHQLTSSIHHPQPQHLNANETPPVLKSTFNTKAREQQKRSDPKPKGQPPQRKR